MNVVMPLPIQVETLIALSAVGGISVCWLITSENEAEMHFCLQVEQFKLHLITTHNAECRSSIITSHHGSDMLVRYRDGGVVNLPSRGLPSPSVDIVLCQKYTRLQINLCTGNL